MCIFIISTCTHSHSWLSIACPAQWSTAVCWQWSTFVHWQWSTAAQCWWSTSVHWQLNTSVRWLKKISFYLFSISVHLAMHFCFCQEIIQVKNNTTITDTWRGKKSLFDTTHYIGCQTTWKCILFPNRLFYTLIHKFHSLMLCNVILTCVALSFINGGALLLVDSRAFLGM